MDISSIYHDCSHQEGILEDVAIPNAEQIVTNLALEILQGDSLTPQDLFEHAFEDLLEDDSKKGLEEDTHLPEEDFPGALSSSSTS